MKPGWGHPIAGAGVPPIDPGPVFALRQLEEEAELNAHVQVLPLQREDRDVAPDTVCEVAGWGTINHSGRRPDKLYQLERPVLSRDVCNHRTRHDHTITEKMMCTDSRRKDTCKVAPAPASVPTHGPGWGYLWYLGLHPEGDGNSLPCAGHCKAALVRLEAGMRPWAQPKGAQ